MARGEASTCFGCTWGVNEMGLLQIAGSSLCISVSSVLLRYTCAHNKSLMPIHVAAMIKLLAFLFAVIVSPLLRALPEPVSAKVLTSAHKKSLSLVDYVSCLDWVYNLDCCLDGSERNAITSSHSFNHDGSNRTLSHTEKRRRQLDLLAYSLLAGVLNYFGAILAVMCVENTSASQSTFIISLYVVLMPFLEWLVFRVWPSGFQLGCLCLACAGIFMVSGASHATGFNLSAGAYYGILSACFKCLNFILEMCSVHLNIDRVSFMLGMLATASVLSFTAAAVSFPSFWFPTEGNFVAGHMTVALISTNTWIHILILGAISCAGFVLQQFGLRNIASGSAGVLVLACNSPASAFLAFVFIGEVLNAEEYTGCALVFVATVLSLTCSDKQAKELSSPDRDDDYIAVGPTGNGEGRGGRAAGSGEGEAGNRATNIVQRVISSGAPAPTPGADLGVTSRSVI